MRSFTLSVFASLAFGLFCSAAPTPVEIPPIPADVAVRSVDVPTQNPECLEVVLTGVVNAVSPLAVKIADLETVEVVTAEVLSPIIGDLKNIIECAIKDVEALAKLDVNVTLKDLSTGVLADAKTIAKLLAAVLHAICPLLKAILQLVTGAVKDEVLPLVVEILCLVAKLLAAVLFIVDKVLYGVVSLLVSLIGDIVPFLRELNVNEILSILCL